MAQKTNPALRVGNDGYYYFTYNQGAKYAVSTGVGTVIYEILDCIYRDEQEWYTVHVQGEILSIYRDMSLERLRYVFSKAKSVTELSEGTMEELPVTKAEVELYYSRYVKARNKRKREASATLNGDKDYLKLVAEEKELTPKLAQAICNESADECELEEKMKKLSAEKRAVMDRLGVKPSELKPPETCEICNGKGIKVRGGICACAYKQKAKIKAFCSAERVVERMKEEQLGEKERSENT